MLKLKAHEICPYRSRCPHISGIENCMGADPNRSNEFTCNFVDNQGNISEHGMRNPNDITGTQKIIHG